MDYLEDEDKNWVDKCYKNSFQNSSDKFMSNNSFLEANLNKLIKFNAEWEPQVVVEGTKLRGNVEDSRDIFDAICSAMQTQQDYCRINVNSQMWRYDNMIWDDETNKFVEIE